MTVCVGYYSVFCLCCCGLTVVQFAEAPVIANPEEAERAMRQVQKLQAGGALDSWEEVPTIVGDIPTTGRPATSDTAGQDLSPPRRGRMAPPDLSPQRKRRREASPVTRRRHDSPDLSPARRTRHDSPDASPPRRQAPVTSHASPPRRAQNSPDASPPRRKQNMSTDASPPRQPRHESPDARVTGRTLAPSDGRPSCCFLMYSMVPLSSHLLVDCSLYPHCNLVEVLQLSKICLHPESAPEELQILSAILLDLVGLTSRVSCLMVVEQAKSPAQSWLLSCKPKSRKMPSSLLHWASS